MPIRKEFLRPHYEDIWKAMQARVLQRKITEMTAGDEEKAIQALAQIGPVLEAGCGDGDFVRFLRENGIQAYGIDKIPAGGTRRQWEPTSDFAAHTWSQMHPALVATDALKPGNISRLEKNFPSLKFKLIISNALLSDRALRETPPERKGSEEEGKIRERRRGILKSISTAMADGAESIHLVEKHDTDEHIPLTPEEISAAKLEVVEAMVTTDLEQPNHGMAHDDRLERQFEWHSKIPARLAANKRVTAVVLRKTARR